MNSLSCDAVVISCHFCQVAFARAVMAASRLEILTEYSLLLRETALSFLCFLDHISGSWPNLENSSWRSPHLATQSALYFFQWREMREKLMSVQEVKLHKMDPFIYILKLSTAESCQEHKTDE